jgi:hypothetical protein
MKGGNSIFHAAGLDRSRAGAAVRRRGGGEVPSRHTQGALADGHGVVPVFSANVLRKAFSPDEK